MATVFLSYTQDTPEHRTRVGALAARLRDDLATSGVEVISDHTCKAGGPDEGWDVWSEKQAERSEIVLPVFNACYAKCWDGEHPAGIRAGGTAEALIIRRRIYECGGPVSFARTVVFAEADRTHIPVRLRGLQSFLADADYAALLAWIKHALAPAPTATSGGAAAWPDSPPALSWPMADQLPVRDAFGALLTAGSAQRILLLHGPTERGKSHLTRHLRGNALRLPWLACGRFDCKGTAGLDGEFPGFLEHLELPAATGSGLAAPERFPAIFAALRERRRPTLLIFDTYEHIGAAERWIEDHLLPAIIRAAWLRVVVAGQRVPDRTRGEWADLALPPLEVREPTAHDWHAHALTNGRDVDLPFVEKACALTRGKASMLGQLLGPAN